MLCKILSAKFKYMICIFLVAILFRAKLPSSNKDKLLQNVDDFSLELEVLEQIQEKLERELNSSKFVSTNFE